jgi:hypothetical protein
MFCIRQTGCVPWLSATRRLKCFFSSLKPQSRSGKVSADGFPAAFFARPTYRLGVVGLDAREITFSDLIR